MGRRCQSMTPIGTMPMNAKIGLIKAEPEHGKRTGESDDGSLT
jgi:hypothetical protein